VVNTTNPIEVAILFLEGGHASTAVGPYEVFRDAGVLWNELSGAPHAPRFRVRTASIDGAPVCPNSSFTIRPDAALADVADSDLVFVSSGGLPLDAVIARNAAVIDFLPRVHGRGARVAGVCTGVALLAASGLLDGRVATSHWALADELRVRFPEVRWRPEDLVTEEDGIYCGGGVHAALDLALHLVERLSDRETARQCAKALVLDMPRECQAGFSVLPIGARHDDEPVRKAERWIHDHCREEVRFDALARALGMSPRNFARRFKDATGTTPLEYLQRLRVRAAQRMLEDDDHRSVAEVGAAVGYEDGAFFRDLFRRHTGLAPAAYRRRCAG
jgi:transcriptional regulator GlxA family with amidase domain